MTLQMIRSESTHDVIVVGGGGSGLAAALSAAEHGARVLLLEKNSHLGGTTGIAVGSFTASATSLQTRSGITDTPIAHAEDAGKFAPPEIESHNNERLRGYFLAHAAETFEWLRGMGLDFHGPSPEPPNRLPRMHNVVPNAKAYIAALQSRLLRLNGQIQCNALVCDLIRQGDRVTGVRVTRDGKTHPVYARRGVVLGTGDYANSPRLIAQYKGDRFSAIEGINPTATGDGHLLAQRVGACLKNMDITYGPENPVRAPVQSRLPATAPDAWSARPDDGQTAADCPAVPFSGDGETAPRHLATSRGRFVRRRSNSGELRRGPLL